MIIEKRKRRRSKVACLQFYRSYRGEAFKVDFIPDTRRARTF